MAMLSSAADAGPPTRVGYLVARAERSFRAELDVITPRHALTTPKYTALSVLRARPGLSSAELARASLVTAQAMHPLVLAMESDGLIRRTADATNRRILRIRLTRRGAAVLAACDRDVDAMDRRALRGLTVKELTELRRLLRTASHNLEQPDA